MSLITCGHRLAGSDDKTVRLWSSTGQAIATLEGHTDEVKAVAWSADGTLASAGLIFAFSLQILFVSCCSSVCDVVFLSCAAGRAGIG